MTKLSGMLLLAFALLVTAPALQAQLLPAVRVLRRSRSIGLDR